MKATKVRPTVARQGRPHRNDFMTTTRAQMDSFALNHWILRRLIRIRQEYRRVVA